MPRAPARAGAPCRRAVRPLLLAVAIVLATTLPAAAHTELSASDPLDGSTRDEPVDRMAFTFSRPVELLPDAATVRGTGDRVAEVTRSDDGTVVTATFAPPLGDDEWTIDWRVLAEDGHPREGTVTFRVDAPGEEGASAGPGSSPPSPTPTGRPDDTGTATATSPPPPRGPPGGLLERSATTARVVVYLGMLLAVGLVLFKAGPHRGEPSRARTLAIVTAAAASVAAIAGVAELALHTAVVSGRGLGGVLDASTWSAIGRTGVGTAAALRTAGLALVAIGASRRARRRVPSGPDAIALVGAVLAIGSFQLVGHTASAAPEVVVRVADAVHATAAAVWVGGIAGLALLASSTDHHARRRAAMRFADAATTAVVAVGIGGVALAWTTMPGVSSLWSTTWDVVLVAKLVVVALLGFLGAHNHVRLIPQLDQDGGRAEVALTQLRRTVRVEAVLMVAVLALTAVLVGLSPV